jgi:monoamine oxidase
VTGPRIPDRYFGAVVVGAGPCGLAAAISLKKAGLTVRVCDRDCVVSSITQYPAYATFFLDRRKAVVRWSAVRGAGGQAIAARRPGVLPGRGDALRARREAVRGRGVDLTRAWNVPGAHAEAW